MFFGNNPSAFIFAAMYNSAPVNAPVQDAEPPGREAQKRRTSMNKLGQFCMSALALGASFMLGCGGGTMQPPQNTVGPTAVLNGSTFPAVNTHWESATCGVQIELSGDGNFRSLVGDISGDKFGSDGTWMASGTSSAVMSGTGIAWISALTNIKGSTASGKFNSGVSVEDRLGDQHSAPSCDFILFGGLVP